MEIWAPNKEAGITDYDWIHWYREHPPDDDLKLLRWSDEQCGGQAHVDWYPFQHPQLGAVELGGWDRMNYWRNPPPHLREREAARFPPWMMQIALSLPRLEVLRTEVRALGADTWRVRFAVANAATCRPTSARARSNARPCAAWCSRSLLPEGCDAGRRQAAHRWARSSKAMRPRTRCRPSCRTAKSPPIARWPNGWCARRAAHGLRLSARADRAGAVHTEAVLD